MRIIRRAAAVAALSIALAAPAYADPDDADSDGPNVTDEICGAFNLGVPPGDIPGRLGANDGRWNYWRAQQRTSQTINEGGCG
jgi:hypothetical protein